MMTVKDMEPIVKLYYEALDEGKILGRKCTACGHIEFPPYLCCNECGNLDTEWVDITDMRGVLGQVLATKGAFGDPEFRKRHGDYWAVEITIQNYDIDPFNSSLLHIDYDRMLEFTDFVFSRDVYVKPLLVQEEDMKVVVWQLEDADSEYIKIPDIKAYVPNESAPDKPEAAASSAGADIDISTDPVAQAVVTAAADAYGVDEAGLTMATDIREDLSNESMKMIAMISMIEDELGVTIEIQEAGNMNTLADFVNKAKELL